MAANKKAKKKSYQQIADMALQRKAHNKKHVFTSAEETALGKMSHERALARKKGK